MSKIITPRLLDKDDFLKQYDSYGNPPKKMFYLIRTNTEFCDSNDINEYSLELKMAKTFDEIPEYEIVGMHDGKSIKDFFPIVMDINESHKISLIEHNINSNI